MTKRILNTYTEYEGPSDLFTEDEQIDQCCEKVSTDLCADVGKTEVYESADSADLDLDALLNGVRAANPGLTINGVQLIDVGPTGDCGEKHTEWTGRLNCCDGVEPLEVDSELSAEVVADNSSGTVDVIGGKLPLTVAVRGSGFYLDSQHTVQDGTFNNFYIKVHTANACGVARITITDGCSTVTHKIRSVNGEWTRIYVSTSGIYGNDDVPAYPGGCPVTLAAYGEFSDGNVLEATSGEFKIRQKYEASTCFGQNYLARSTYEQLLPSCDWGHCSSESDLTGSCFVDDDRGMGCMEVEIPDGSSNYDHLWLSYTLGLHTSFLAPTTIWEDWYGYRSYVTVTYTEVFKWIC